MLWKQASICRSAPAGGIQPLGPQALVMPSGNLKEGWGPGSLFQTGGFEDAAPFLSGKIQLTLKRNKTQNKMRSELSQLEHSFQQQGS